MQYMKIIIFFIATIIISNPVFADSMSCENGLVSDRDTTDILYKKCGQPLQIKGNVLLYDLGSGRFLREVVIEGGVIRKITTTSQYAESFNGNWQVDQTNKIYDSTGRQPVIMQQVKPSSQVQNQQQPVQQISSEVQQMADELNEMRKQQEIEIERQRREVYKLEREEADKRYNDRGKPSNRDSERKPYVDDDYDDDYRSYR